MKNKITFPQTDIYGITAWEYSRGRTNLEVVIQMIRAGIKVIQYRQKEGTLKEKYRECLAIRELTKDAGVVFIVNDHVDLALAVGADGVHIGQDDLPVPEIRRIAGENFLIGLSTHSPAQAAEALALKVDYIGVGPVFATATKKDVVAPVGLTYVAYVSQNIPLPGVAIGGIKEDNIGEVLAHGARTVALVTDIVGADDIGRKVARLRQIIASAGKEI